ncbi:unnamed protein product, partial [marine sediment metagenome]
MICSIDVLKSILDNLYKAELIDLSYTNQYTMISYSGNGIIIPKEWNIKIMHSGELVCSNAEFFEYLLSFCHTGELPGIKQDEYRNITETLNKKNIQIRPILFDFPNEESKWVWIAGIVDAECSLSLQKSKKNTKRGFQYIPRLNCSSTTPILLFQFKKACHPYGSVTSHHYQDNRNDFWKSYRKLGIYSNGLRLSFL